jgi:hypothetical protein
MPNSNLLKFEPCSHISSLDAEYFTLRLRVMELQQEINELVKKGMADGPGYHAKVTMLTELRMRIVSTFWK